MTNEKRKFIPVEIYQILFQEKKVKSNHLIVLCALFLFDMHGKTIYPSIGKVAHYVGMSESQIKRIFKELIEMKILIRKGKTKFGTGIYEIDISVLPDKEIYVGKKQKARQSFDESEQTPFDNDSLDCSSNCYP